MDNAAPTAVEVSPARTESRADFSTWSQRNPDKSTIPSRPPRPKATDAEKATRALRAQAARIKREELAAELELFEDEQEAKLKELAEKHGRSLDYVTQLLRTSSHYKQKRAPSLHNAILYDKTLKLNAGTFFLSKIALFC